jgi:CDP-glucose 4,6-dehydratase
VVVTTDKCYENHESISPYRETDRLGGVDPYSSSKACAELITSAYRASFFSTEGNVKIATARAGNVIGGGDWGENRLVPDCMRAFVKEKNLNLRYPQAVRPWQHVLEPIYGYLLLAENLLSEEGQYYTESWNFGPEYTDIKTVEEVARQISTYLNITIEQDEQTEKKHEASLLHLDSTKVKERLHWFPRWDLSEAIKYTVKWYQEWMQGKDMLHFSRVQLAQYAGKIIND